MDQKLEIDLKYFSLIKFAFPTIVATIFSSIYGIVDGVFVANYVGTDALSAVNIFLPFLLIIVAVGIMLGAGGNALISKKIGENKIQQARENFSLILLSCLVISLVISILGLVFMDHLIYFLGANRHFYELSVDYAIPTLIILPMAMIGVLYEIFFIAEGRPTLGMIFSVCGGCINMFLDWLLIAKLNLGISGAAIATGAGFSFTAIAGTLYFLLHRNGNLFIVKPCWNLKVISKSSSNGTSEMIGILAASIIVLIMNKTLIRLAGSDGIAASSVIYYVQTILTSLFSGYTTGVSSLISYNFGKQDSTALKKIHRINMRLISSISIIIFLLGFVIYKPIISIFAPSTSNVYAIATNGYIIYSISFIFIGLNFYFSGLFTALNDGKVSGFLSFCRTFVLEISFMLLLPVFLGINGIWLATPVAEFLGLLIGIYFLYKKKEVYQYM